MLIKIGQFEITECWDGVFYKTLSHYPDITKWEIQTVLDFERYEEINGRKCGIQAEQKIIDRINAYREIYNTGARVPVPEKIEECTACPTYKGCMTDFVCHTTSAENAVKILNCGSLLSPVRARHMSEKDLQKSQEMRPGIRRIIFSTSCLPGKLSGLVIVLLWKENWDAFPRVKMISVKDLPRECGSSSAMMN